MESMEIDNSILEPVDEVQLIEENKQNEEITDLIDSTDTAERAANNLNTLAGYVASAEKRGGMSPALAQVVAFSHECIVSSMGYTARGKSPTTSKVVESLEDFKNADTRRYKTYETAESIRRTAGVVLERVVRAIKKLIEMITEFVKDRLRQSDQLEKGLKAIKARLSKIKAKDKYEDIHGPAAFSTVDKAKIIIRDTKELVDTCMALSQDVTANAAKNFTEHQGDKVDAIMDELFDKYEGLVKIRDGIVEKSSGEAGQIQCPKPAELQAMTDMALTSVKKYNDALNAWESTKAKIVPLLKYGELKSRTDRSDKGNDLRFMNQRVRRPAVNIQSQVFQTATSGVVPTIRRFLSYSNAATKNMVGQQSESQAK